MEIQVLYDGSFPNLCSGQLVVILTVKGKTFNLAFPSYCLHSQGGLDSDYCAYDGDWEITEWPEILGEDNPCCLRQHTLLALTGMTIGEIKDEILEQVNSEVTHGCCGGCA